MRRLSETLKENIRKQITHGQLRVGDKLPPEREMAELYSVGRPVVREALRELEGAGLLEFRAGAHGGAFVKASDGAAIVQSVNDAIFLGAASLKEITEARLCILGRAVELAAMRGTKDDFDELDANIDITEALLLKGEDELSIAAIMDFYGILGSASKNEMLAILNEALSNIVVKVLLKLRAEVVIKDFIDTRRSIAKHLRNKAPELAREALEKHLLILHRIVESTAEELYELKLSHRTNYSEPSED